ncbi:MAG: division/cell wall cluster transcriptional repressor MraZ [Minisyncoccia bacterium]
MFIGEYHFTIDNKGRMAIPSKLRKELMQEGVLTRGLDNCLFLYTHNDWEQIAEKIKNLPLSQTNARAFSRLMLAGAMEVEMDGQGRILIPEYLRQYAHLNKKVVLAGVYNRLEIWDEAEWENYKIKTEKDSTDIAEKLGDLGI